MLMQVLGGGAPWPRLRLPAGGLVRAEAGAATNRGFTRADPDAPGGSDRPTYYPPCKRLCNGAQPFAQKPADGVELDNADSQIAVLQDRTIFRRGQYANP
jgi:hypothetical protein